MALKFYSDNDLQIINDNIDTIIDNASRISNNKLEPKQEEYNMIKKEIINFIKENKRIVYGGSAYHAIIQKYRSDKDSLNTIYQEWARYDIEFYSPDPINDMIEICNKLNKLKISHIMGRQAQHDETFTIFANFVQYCDISYMSQNVFDNIKYIDINGLKYIHPEISLIDIFRMYNDPLTSSWRYKKTFGRMKLYMEKFPFEFTEYDKIVINDNNINNKIIKEICPILFDKYYNDILLTGQIAYNSYIDEKNNDKKLIYFDNVNCIEIITQKQTEIGKYIKSLLYEWSSKNNIKYNDFDIIFYHRFFQFWNERTIIYYKNFPLFIILNNNGRCYPYNTFKVNNSDTSIMIGSFLVTFNYFFIGYYYEQILNLGFYFKDRNFINSLLTIRNNFLIKNKKTVLDNTIYKEFIFDCYGNTMEFGRESLLKNIQRREKGIRQITYDPVENYGDKLYYVFENSTGTEYEQ